MKRRRKLTAMLPPTFVTPEMRDAVVVIAEREETSIADIVREALSLFLSENDSKSIMNESQTKHKEN